VSDYTFELIKELEGLEVDVKKSMENATNFDNRMIILMVAIYKLVTIYLKAKLHRMF